MSTTTKPQPEVRVGDILILADGFRTEAANENGTIAGRLRAHKLVQLLEEVIERRTNSFIDARAIELRMRERCFHDFIEMIDAAQTNAPSDGAKQALLQFGASVVAQGADDLGEGTCDCDQPDCPYREEAADANASHA